VRLGPASGHVVELSALPAAPVTSFVVTWELRAADRTLRLSGRRPAGPSLHGGATLRIVLEPGEYEVRARAGLGAPEAMRFTVPTPPGQAPLVMRLR